MSALKLHTLKQKLWAIVVASFVARFIVFLTLPDGPSAFAPDEGAYAKLAKWVSESKPTSQFPEFGPGLYQSSRAIILPASYLVRLGISELNSVRLSSSIYGLFTLILLAIFITWLSENSKANSSLSRQNVSLITILFAVFAFLPSHFLWSNLGLREAGNEFWLICVFLLTYSLRENTPVLKCLSAALLPLCIVFVFSSRPQVGLLVVLTLMLYSLINWRSYFGVQLIVLAVLGLLGGHASTTSVSLANSKVLIAKEIPNPSLNKIPFELKEQMENEASKQCDFPNQRIEVKQTEYICTETVVPREVPQPILSKTVGQIDSLPEKQLANQVSAESKIETITCPINETGTYQKLACVILRAPLSSVNFLFRPLPIFDTTSKLSFMASVENLLWIFGFLILAIRLFKTKVFHFRSHLLPTMMFLSLYVVGAGSYEGNMGTAFRHKSLILSGLLILLFSTLIKDNQESGQTSRKARFN